MLFYFPLTLLLLASIDAFESSINDATFDSDYEGNERLLNEFAEFSNADGDRIRRLFAQRMLKFMNKSVDPCEDFYEYACGNYGEYLKNTTVTGEYKLATLYSLRKLESLVKTEGADADLTDPIREFYDLCMNYNFSGPYNVNFFSDLMDEFLPLSPRIVLNWLHKLNIDLFYTWNETENAIIVDSLLKEPTTSEAETIKSKFNIDEERFSQMILTVKQFEEQIMGEDGDEVATYNKIDLYSVFSQLGLSSRTEGSGNDVKIVGYKLLRRLAELMLETDNSDIYRFVFWHVLWKLSALEEQILALEPPDKIERVCFEHMMKYRENEALYIFGRKNLDSPLTEDVSDIIERIREEIKLLFEENQWLPPAVKEELVQKVINIRKIIGAPDFMLEKPQPRNEWKYGTENFFDNVFSLMRQNDEAGNRVDTGRVADCWKGTDPFLTNAFYCQDEGILILVPSILVYPFYNIHFPNFYKYGNLGVTIGHELMHGFDNDGLKYDSEHEERDWIPPRIEKKLIRDKECYYQQYQKHKTDGVLTMVENLPDNVGLEMAFLAYKKWAEGEPKVDQIEMDGFEDLEMDKYQAFFLSNAQSFCNINATINPGDEHASDYIRVLGSFSNSENFAEAFNCPVGSKMNPRKKCSYLS